MLELTVPPAVPSLPSSSNRAWFSINIYSRCICCLHLSMLQRLGSRRSHGVLPRVFLPVLGPLLFRPHTLGIFRQCFPCVLSRRVRCDPAVLMSSADGSCTRLRGQAHLCAELLEELWLQPCLLSAQPCRGPWCWLSSPSPSAPSSPMRSSNALQPWFAPPLLPPAPSAHQSTAPLSHQSSEGMQNG